MSMISPLELSVEYGHANHGVVFVVDKVLVAQGAFDGKSGALVDELRAFIVLAHDQPDFVQPHDFERLPEQSFENALG